jgi:hypothetical protein
MRPSYKSGIITGVAVGLFAISAFSFFNWLKIKNGWDIQPGTIRGLCGLLTVLIQVIGIYFSMAGTRKVLSGVISYGQAFKAGFTVALITALITAFCALIYCTVINPGYTDYMVNEAHKDLVASGESAGQIAKDMVAVKWEFSAGGQVIAALAAQLLVGTAASLIIAIFYQKQKTLNMKKLILLLAIWAFAAPAFAQQVINSNKSQFMFIIRFKADFKPSSDDAVKNNIKKWQDYMGGLAKPGDLVSGFRPASNGLTISGKEKSLSNSPYVSDGLLVSSIMIIKAANMEEAKEIAGKCPVYEFGGSVEVRPMMNIAGQ